MQSQAYASSAPFRRAAALRSLHCLGATFLWSSPNLSRPCGFGLSPACFLCPSHAQSKAAYMLCRVTCEKQQASSTPSARKGSRQQAAIAGLAASIGRAAREWQGCVCSGICHRLHRMHMFCTQTYTHQTNDHRSAADTRRGASIKRGRCQIMQQCHLDRGRRRGAGRRCSARCRAAQLCPDRRRACAGYLRAAGAGRRARRCARAQRADDRRMQGAVPGYRSAPRVR